jgi:hypothetical protein
MIAAKLDLLGGSMQENNRPTGNARGKAGNTKGKRVLNFI